MAGILEADFDAAVEPLLEPAFRLAQVVLRDRGAAEDAVQDAAFKAWRALPQFRGEAAGFRAWFLKIVVNECRQQRRQRWWSVLRSDRLAPVAASPEAAVGRRTDLDRALLALDEKERAALYLRYYLDLDHAEIARVLGVREGAARSRVHRALARLRPLLEAEGEA